MANSLAGMDGGRPYARQPKTLQDRSKWQYLRQMSHAEPMIASTRRKSLQDDRRLYADVLNDIMHPRYDQGAISFGCSSTTRDWKQISLSIESQKSTRAWRGGWWILCQKASAEHLVGIRP